MSDDLSRSVAQATEYLTGIHSDIQSLISAIDGLLEPQGWRPAFGNKVGDLSNSLQGSSWVLRYFYRFYLFGVGDPSQAAERIIIVVGHLAPPPGSDHDFAALLAVATRFSPPQTAREVYDRWEESTRLYRAALGRPGPVSLIRQEYVQFAPKAVGATAIALPLCSLSGVDAVRESLVKPILQAESQLTFGEPAK
ncbi:hypothetical protein [Gemmata sp.]|uniref:hypothetical protein n=1 Tax=Gemmata sp. TaxID=1914242 RepID=UPI003F730EDA